MSLSYTVDINKIAESLDLSYKIPKKYLLESFTCDPHIREVVNELIQEERGENISNLGKRKLLNIFLEYLFISGPRKNPETNSWETFFLELHPFNSEGKTLEEKLPVTFWFHLFCRWNEDLFPQLQALKLMKNSKQEDTGIFVYWND